jgi:transposase InsO family protein
LIAAFDDANISIFGGPPSFAQISAPQQSRKTYQDNEQATEFTSNAMVAWAQQNSITWNFIAPGKPMQNGFCELG